MADVMIHAKNVTRNFSISRGMLRGNQTLRAVNGVDLKVDRGEVLALVGESGCGKTTLAKILLGLMPQTKGTVSVCGQQINDIPRLELARLIQPVFQDPYSSLNPRKSIGSIIGLPMRVQAIESQEIIKQRVEETMNLVNACYMPIQTNFLVASANVLPSHVLWSTGLKSSYVMNQLQLLTFLFNHRF